MAFPTRQSGTGPVSPCDLHRFHRGSARRAGPAPAAILSGHWGASGSEPSVGGGRLHLLSLRRRCCGAEATPSPCRGARSHVHQAGKGPASSTLPSREGRRGVPERAAGGSGPAWAWGRGGAGPGRAEPRAAVGAFPRGAVRGAERSGGPGCRRRPGLRGPLRAGGGLRHCRQAWRCTGRCG